MVKSKNGTNAKKASDDGTAAKKSGGGGTGGGGGGGRAGGGLDEIDSLFATKKQSAREMQESMDREEEASRLERKRRKRARMEEEAEETALRGFCPTASSSSSAPAAGTGTKGRGGDAAAPSNLHERATKLKSLTYTREDVERLNNRDGDDDGKNGGAGGEARDRWATDGHGGVFNGEGFTGRRDDGGHRVFKAHLMNRKGFGTSPDCPFDCDCCFI